MAAAFHSSFGALLVSEPNQSHFHPLAVTPATTVLPRLARNTKLLGLVRLLGKPIDSSTSLEVFDDELPTEGTATDSTAQFGLVAPVVTAGAQQREAFLVLGPKRSDEPYDRDDRSW